MEIREANERDVGRLVALNRDVQAVHAAAQPRFFKAMPDGDAVAAWFDALLTRPEARVLIGEVEDRAVGYAVGLIRPHPDNPFRHGLTIGVIDQLSVRPAYQRRGYGEALLDSLLAHFGTIGVERIELSVWAFNEAARDFYLRRGFAYAQHSLALD